MSLGMKAGLGLGDIMLDWDPALPKKGLRTPTFRPMSIVVKRSPISATAELLFSLHTRDVRGPRNAGGARLDSARGVKTVTSHMTSALLPCAVGAGQVP